MGYVHPILSIGDKVILSKTKKDGTDCEYKSSIQDFLERTKLLISMPIEKGAYVPLKSGEIFKTVFYTKASIYSCKLEIVDRFKKGNQYYLAAEIKSELEKVQRREYFRMEYVNRLFFSKIDEIDVDVYDSDELVWEKATVTDISGGGMRFNSAVKPEGCKKILIRVDFLSSDENDKERIFRAEVRSTGKVPNQEDLYEYRVCFEGITTKDREDVVKFIFEEERRRRKIDRS